MINIDTNLLIYYILLNKICIIFNYDDDDIFKMKKIIIFNFYPYIYLFCYFKIFKNYYIN